MEIGETVLEAHDLYRFYHIDEEETLALKGVTLDLKAGEFVVVLGPSGAGKSTLLGCLAGLDEPDGGYVNIRGQRITRKPERRRAELRAREIGILLQSGNLFSHLTVAQNVALQLHLSGKKGSKATGELFDRLGIRHVRESRPEHISGGETARAGLAVAMAAEPSVLLADEPTGELDAETEQRVLVLLDSYRSKGKAVLVVTHSDAVASHADRIINLFDGRVTDE